MRGYVGPRRTMLVVDDDPIQRELLRELLGAAGLQDGDRGERHGMPGARRQHKPNLVLLDISMPDMDGWEIARRLRQASRERTAIVMVSANAIEPSRLLGRGRLHDDYLMKPIDLASCWTFTRCWTSNGSTSRRP